jgi:2-(1,2-epoxy-1,2-dihydrophenyl)acetyl-CoA isomerase
MSENRVVFSTDDGVARITINRPDVMGAIHTEMWAQMLAFVQSIEHDPAVRCLLISSVGKHFSAGGDVKEFATTVDMATQDLATHWMRTADRVNPFFVTLERIPQPVVCSVRGVAAGGGFAIAMGSDLVIASETARFFAAQIKLGAIPDSGLSFQLRRAIGIKKAKQYCFLGDTIDAATAERLGMVNWVVPDAELEAETEKLVARLKAMPVVALARTKATLNDSFHNTLADHFVDEARDVGLCVSHPDYGNAVRAFVGKAPKV